MVNKGKGTQADVLKITFIKTVIGHLLHLGRWGGVVVQKVKLQRHIFSGKPSRTWMEGWGIYLLSTGFPWLQLRDWPRARLGIPEQEGVA